MKFEYITVIDSALTDLLEEAVLVSSTAHKGSSRSQITATATHCSESKSGLAVKAYNDKDELVGVILGLVTPEITTDTHVATCIVVYTRGKYPRIAKGLMDIFEQWARNWAEPKPKYLQYASYIRAFDKLLERKGFHEVERVYSKELDTWQ